ncbi:PspC domain-containing protein [Nocardiopsis coralliicola]
MDDEQQPTLVRDSERGVLTGVCTGLGRSTGTDPVLWRVAFALTGLAGGAGVLLYVGAWLTMRDTTGGPAMFEQLLNRTIPPRAVLPLLAAATALLTALSLVGGFSWGTLVMATPLIVGVLSARNRGVDLQAAFRELPSLLRTHSPPPAAPTPEPAPSYYNPAQPWAQAPSGPVDLAVVSGSRSSPAAEAAEEDSAAEQDEEQGGGGTGTGCARRRPMAYLPPRAWKSPESLKPKRARPNRGMRLLSPVVWLSVAAAGVALLAAGEVSAAALVGPAQGQVYLGGVTVIIGLALALGTWFGDPRGLVVFGLVAVLAASIAATTDLPSARFGDRVWRPADAAEAAREHRVAIGSATLDLTELDLHAGETVPVAAGVSVGTIEVIVPRSAHVELSGRTGFGAITADGWERSGPNLSVREEFAPVPAGSADGDRVPPVLRIELSTGVGDMEVQREAA